MVRCIELERFYLTQASNVAEREDVIGLIDRQAILPGRFDQLSRKPRLTRAELVRETTFRFEARWRLRAALMIALTS